MKKINTALIYIFSIHLLALSFMSSQRIILLLTNLEQIQQVESKFSWILSSLLRGLWFDNVIACYITTLPLFVVLLFGLFNFINRHILNVINSFYAVTFTIVFGFGIADIPYFKYFFKHLNTSVFNWKEETGTAMNMILQEKSYYIYFLFYLLSVSLFIFLIFRLSKKLLTKQQININSKLYFVYVPLSLLLVGASIFGIRGRTGYNPISSSQAYFCNNSFLNQLGINPLFFFMRDVIETSKAHISADELISEAKAVEVTKKEYGLGNSPSPSPVWRQISAIGEPKKMNVVIVLMESMSADLLKIKENGKEITPYLNQLISKSYYFDNFYSAGNHTNHGIIATLYGLPSLFDQNIMKNVDVAHCDGLPILLQREGYKTLFFMSHEGQYDNMKAFLTENGENEIYAQEDYPAAKRVNSFGVPDDFLLSFAFDTINERGKSNVPFLATVLTISNHPPYIVPDKFKKVSKDPQYQIVAYADDAIRQFMQKAEKTSWYKNTIFVFLADHGKMVGSQTYEMPLSYNHIPLIIHSPALKDTPHRFEQLGGQVDVFPTLLGLLNCSYVNNGFGVDLLKTERPYMFFSSDNSLGCITKDYFYTYNFKTKFDRLYKYRENDPTDFLPAHKAEAKRLQTLSAAMIQTTNYMFKHKLTKINSTSCLPRK